MDHKRFLVPSDGSFALSKMKTDDTDGYRSKGEAAIKLAADIQELSKMQATLYAQDTYGVLLIFQAMDTAGKDGAIKHVLTGVNPQGIEVHNFRRPNTEELDHDFLWRCAKVVPERGRIGIFNRSYYEEVLTVRVHPEFVEAQKLPKSAMTKHFWRDRFEDINHFERYLTRNGIIILKFYLHISKAEQKRRLMERIETHDKNYKITPEDIHERSFWKEYMHAYSDMLRSTSTEYAPWHVIPSDHKWFTRVVVADAIVRKLHSLDLEYPETSKKALDAARKALMQEK